MLDVLILGCGNTLRGDEALGIHAAHALHDFYCTDGGMRVLATSQLTLDLAEDISQAHMILFIDAAASGLPGEIHSEEILPADEKVRVTHHWTPPTLLMLCKQMYGRAPQAVSLTMAVASSEVGVGLSQEIEHRLPELLERAKAIVSSWRLGHGESKHRTTANPKVESVQH
jgi:hydrogenase maturation protease